MFNDTLTMKGRLDIVLIGPDGSEKDRRTLDNLVVTTGKNYVASRMAGTSSAVMSHMAIGTSATAAAAGDTALGTEAARTALTSSTVNSNEVVYVDTFAAGTGTGAITEAGVFNASSGGTMLCRTVFSAVNKSANDGLTITWSVQAS